MKQSERNQTKKCCCQSGFCVWEQGQQSYIGIVTLLEFVSFFQSFFLLPVFPTFFQQNKINGSVYIVSVETKEEDHINLNNIRTQRNLRNISFKLKYFIQLSFNWSQSLKWSRTTDLNYSVGALSKLLQILSPRGEK